MLHGCFTDAQVLTFENDLITSSDKKNLHMACSSRIACLVKGRANLFVTEVGCGMGGVKRRQKDGDEEEQDCETVHVGRFCKTDSDEVRELCRV